MARQSLAPLASFPLDPIKHRAHLTSIYASLPPYLQTDALALVKDLPRMIHNLARAGELAGLDVSVATLAADRKARRAA